MFDFDVTPDDGETYRVTAKSRDVVRWERTGKGRTLKRLSDVGAMTDLVALAHIASLRTGQFSGSITEFEQNTDVDPIPPADDDDEDGEGEDTASDPTQPAL